MVLLAQKVGRSLLIRAALNAFINRSPWLELPRRQCKAQNIRFSGRSATFWGISLNCLRNQWVEKSRCLSRAMLTSPVPRLSAWMPVEFAPLEVMPAVAPAS